MTLNNIYNESLFIRTLKNNFQHPKSLIETSLNPLFPMGNIDFDIKTFAKRELSIIDLSHFSAIIIFEPILNIRA
jgi:hypothetical protein